MNTVALVAGWVWIGLALLVVAFGLLCIVADVARGLRHPFDDTEERQLRKARAVTGRVAEVVPLPRREQPTDRPVA